MRHSRILTAFSFVLLLAAVGCGPGNDEMNDDGMNAADDSGYEEVQAPAETTEMETSEATATLMTADGTEVATVTFTAQATGGIDVSADLHDVEGDGMHGFHIHEGSECSAPTFESAGGHLNPGNTPHACPDTRPRHAGDLGNVQISGGSGTFDTDSQLLTVTPGPHSVVGRTVILHAGEDDCTSQPSGAAGDRWACGVIEASDDMMDGGAMDDDMMDDEGGAVH